MIDGQISTHALSPLLLGLAFCCFGSVLFASSVRARVLEQLHVFWGFLVARRSVCNLCEAPEILYKGKLVSGARQLSLRHV